MTQTERKLEELEERVLLLEAQIATIAPELTPAKEESEPILEPEKPEEPELPEPTGPPEPLTGENSV